MVFSTGMFLCTDLVLYMPTATPHAMASAAHPLYTIMSAVAHAMHMLAVSDA
jgi:hypothetical protein